MCAGFVYLCDTKVCSVHAGGYQVHRVQQRRCLEGGTGSKQELEAIKRLQIETKMCVCVAAVSSCCHTHTKAAAHLRLHNFTQHAGCSCPSRNQSCLWAGFQLSSRTLKLANTVALHLVHPLNTEHSSNSSNSNINNININITKQQSVTAHNISAMLSCN